jgi:hypothetical protein
LCICSDLGIGGAIEVVVVECAIERVGLTGAALVHEDDVTVAVNTLERVSGGCVERCRRHAGAAGEDE